MDAVLRTKCRELIVERDQTVVRNAVLSVMVAQPVQVVAEAIVVVRGERFWMLIWLHVGIALLCGLSLFFSRSRSAYSVWYFGGVIAFLMPSGYLWSLYEDAVNGQLAFAILGATVSMAVCIFVCLLAAFSRYWEPAILCIGYFVCFAVAASPLPVARQMTMIGGFVFLATMCLKMFMIRGKWQGAASELARRAAAQAAERELQERDLRMASLVQDSCRPTAPLGFEGMRVSFHIVKHETIGGDWFSVERLTGDSFLAIVVDAAGKGIQAALVVHAVQSLWIAARKDRSFDVDAWIRHVNEALIRMGSGTVHAVAVGLMRVERDRATYWSAGLGPLYHWREGESEKPLASHFGRGTMLGITPTVELVIKPTEVRFDRRRTERLFLGTDGVFLGSRRHDGPVVDRLLLELPACGDKALASIPIADDKALIHVELLPLARAA